MLGCDSVQNAVHNGRMFWAWGDTNFARYPLGIFDMSSATTAIQPLASFEPPLRLKFDYFTDDAGRPRGVAKMAGEGPTWLSGYMSLPDKTGTKRLVAVYMKIKPPMEGYECGLCVWNEKTANFRAPADGVDEIGGDAETSADAARASGDHRRRRRQEVGAVRRSVSEAALSGDV